MRFFRRAGHRFDANSPFTPLNGVNWSLRLERSEVKVENISAKVSRPFVTSPQTAKSHWRPKAAASATQILRTQEHFTLLPLPPVAITVTLTPQPIVTGVGGAARVELLGERFGQPLTADEGERRVCESVADIGLTLYLTGVLTPKPTGAVAKPCQINALIPEESTLAPPASQAKLPTLKITLEESRAGTPKTDFSPKTNPRFSRGEVAPNSIEMQPYGGPGGGHHTPPKKAFEGAPGYDKNTALAIPNDVLKSLKIDHPKITGAQAKLYSAFSKLCKPLTSEVIEEIETKALIAGGANPGQALATVKKALQALKDAGVTGPTQIPWGR